VTPRWIAWISVALLVCAWLFDMLTPQRLVAAILLTIPVALASVFLTRRFSSAVIVLSLVANVAAGWYNGAREGGHWDSITIANRLLAAFSIVLVGYLGSIAQSAAERSGRLAARQRLARRNESLRWALERIRSSLNVDLVARAIVREAIDLFDADVAWLYVADGGTFDEITYSIERGGADVGVHRAPAVAGLAQFLRRALERREPLALLPTDPVARLCLDALGADHARIAPLADSQVDLGVLVLAAREPGHLEGDIDLFVQSFGEQAGVAMSQAKLFVELARKNDELAAANRSIEDRGEIIRDIVFALSHDLRTPLAAAAMTLQQALDGKYGELPEAYREILRRSVDSNNEVRRLAETLLLVAKYESGEQSVARRSVELGKIARSVVDELEPLWLAKGLRLRVGDDETAVALGDEGELRRAVMNLVSNAIAWTPEGGTIAVGIERNGAVVSLSVEDEGYGVPEAERAALFDRFPSRMNARPGSGSGLGLYIVRRIAESHRGSIAYNPVTPRGSKFTLTLPADSAATVKAAVNG
jgi:signal transduction histidine kinase